MPYCPSCGRSVRAGVRFCSECGARLDIQAESMGIQHQEHASKRSPDAPTKCPYCGGSGQVLGLLDVATPIRCPVCKGSGSNLMPADWRQCKDCNGTGQQFYDGGGITEARRPCPNCKGAGWAL